MEDSSRTFDFSAIPPARVQSAAFQALKDLEPGTSVLLVLAAEPTLLMQSLDLQLRHNLAWTAALVDGRWQVVVSHRADSAPGDALDLLERDHKRLDGLLAQVLQQLSRGLVDDVVPLLENFVSATRRHIAVEDEVLAPTLAAGGSGSGDDPLSIMLRDHREIRQQLVLIEGALAESESAELSVYCAILSGTLAKHEYREENNLFPCWRAALRALPQPVRDGLLASVGAALRR
jgi:hemerythrin-like domain-containing protein